MLEKYDENQNYPSLSIKGVDPNLEIDTRQITENKKKFGIELINEIINSENVPEEDKEKYREIQKKIQSHYYYSFEEIHGSNFHMIKYFEENEMIMENKILLNLVLK